MFICCVCVGTLTVRTIYTPPQSEHSHRPTHFNDRHVDGQVFSIYQITMRLRFWQRWRRWRSNERKTFASRRTAFFLVVVLCIYSALDCLMEEQWPDSGGHDALRQQQYCSKVKSIVSNLRPLNIWWSFVGYGVMPYACFSGSAFSFFCDSFMFFGVLFFCIWWCGFSFWPNAAGQINQNQSASLSNFALRPLFDSG